MKYCIYCNSNNTFEIDSLKHYWTYCLNCKNQKSFQKNKETIFNTLSLFFLILDKFFKTTLQNMLCYYKTSPSDQYYYYKDVIKNHRYEDTKWFSYDSEFILFLKNNLIDLQDKKVISISEEPGFFYKLIKDKCRKVLFTALNNSVTEIMIQQIGVDTITYDANKDDISKLVNDYFDIILIRSVIGHIDDLEKFINQIKKIAHKDTVVVLTFHTPNLQAGIIFGYDDYTFGCFYDSKFVQKLFEKENFKIIKIISSKKNLLDKYYKNKRKGLLFLPLYYIFKFKTYLINLKKTGGGINKVIYKL